MATLVSGFFTSPANAQHAVDELLKFGFAREDIRWPFSLSPEEDSAPSRESARLPVVAGAVIGGLLGALAAGVAAAGPFSSPEAPLLAAGPIAVALTGFSAGAAAGGVTGALIGRGNPDGQAVRDDGPQPPGTRIGVRVHDGRIRLVRYVLGTCGAEQITKQ